MRTILAFFKLCTMINNSPNIKGLLYAYEIGPWLFRCQSPPCCVCSRARPREHHCLESTRSRQSEAMVDRRTGPKSFPLKVMYMNYPHISLAKANHLAKPIFTVVGSMIPSDKGTSRSTDSHVLTTIMVIKDFLDARH